MRRRSGILALQLHTGPPMKVKIGTLDTIISGPGVWVNDSQPFVAV